MERAAIREPEYPPSPMTRSCALKSTTPVLGTPRCLLSQLLELHRVRLAAGSLDEFESVPRWIAHEEAPMPAKSIRDYFGAGIFEAASKRVEVGDAKAGMATRRLVRPRRLLARGQMDLLHAALVPCPWAAAVRVGGLPSGLAGCRPGWRDVRSVRARADPRRMRAPLTARRRRHRSQGLRDRLR